MNTLPMLFAASALTAAALAIEITANATPTTMASPLARASRAQDGQQPPAPKPRGRRQKDHPPADDGPISEEIALHIDPERPPAAKQSTAEESRVPDGAPLAQYESLPVQVVENRHPDQSLARRSYVIVQGGKPTAIDHGPDWRWFANQQIWIKRSWTKGKQNGAYQEWYETGFPKARGNYVDDQKDGAWSSWYSDGRAQSERTFKLGQPEGRAREWFPSGIKRLDQTYKQGQLEGLDESWYVTGEKHFEVHWRDGKRQGTSTEWYNKGHVKAQGDYENGVEVGLWTRIDDEGQKFEESYKAGVLEGHRTVWNAEGKKTSEGDYAKGKATGLHVSYFPSGAKLSVTEFKDGVQDGSVHFYYEDGKLQIEGEMKAGKKEGLWTYWNPDGTRDPTWSGRYHEDKKLAD